MKELIYRKIYLGTCFYVLPEAFVSDAMYDAVNKINDTRVSPWTELTHKDIIELENLKQNSILVLK